MRVEGYLEKDASPEELAAAIEAVASGRSYFSRRFQEAIAKEGGKAVALGKILSRREQQVLAHVMAGRSASEIGQLMAISSRTAEFHRANVMAKLGAGIVTELVAMVTRLKLG